MTDNRFTPRRDLDSDTVRGETLDEAIDRVADGLTMVPSDEAFGTRLRARLESPSRRAPLALALAVTTAVVVIAAVTSDVWRARRQSAAPVIGAPATRAVGELPAVRESSVPTEGITTSTATPVPRGLEHVESSATAIAALAAPDVLGVYDVDVEALAIAPVGVDALEFADLAVREIDGSGESRE